MQCSHVLLQHAVYQNASIYTSMQPEACQTVYYIGFRMEMSKRNIQVNFFSSFHISNSLICRTITLWYFSFYTKLKTSDVSTTDWMVRTLQAAWYIRHVRWACLFYVPFITCDNVVICRHVCDPLFLFLPTNVQRSTYRTSYTTRTNNNNESRMYDITHY